MSVLLTTSIVTLALGAWFSVFKIVPDCATSHFRYRLWRLRDCLVDEIRHGEYENAEKPRRLLALIELVIAEAADLSALNLLLAHLAARGVERRDDPLGLRGLRVEDASRLQKHRSELEHAMFAKAFAGTPSGWIAMLIAGPLAVIAVVARLAAHGNRDGGSLVARVERRVVADLELSPALDLMSSCRRKPLHHYV